MGKLVPNFSEPFDAHKIQDIQDQENQRYDGQNDGLAQNTEQKQDRDQRVSSMDLFYLIQGRLKLEY